jgi:hypothetical protein
MISQESQEIARQAEWLSEHRLKALLEPVHTGEFVTIEPTSGAYFVGATLSVEHRRRLVGDKVRLTNRLTSALKNYFPQVLQWFQEKDTAIFGAFLSR